MTDRFPAQHFGSRPNQTKPNQKNSPHVGLTFDRIYFNAGRRQPIARSVEAPAKDHGFLSAETQITPPNEERSGDKQLGRGRRIHPPGVGRRRRDRPRAGTAQLKRSSTQPSPAHRTPDDAVPRGCGCRRRGAGAEGGGGDRGGRVV
jgi:hypothetical protein